MSNKTTPLSQIVEEQKAYERRKHARCGLSWIEPMKDITIRSFDHAGTIAHICGKNPHAGGEACECLCGARALVKK